MPSAERREIIEPTPRRANAKLEGWVSCNMVGKAPFRGDTKNLVVIWITPAMNERAKPETSARNSYDLSVTLFDVVKFEICGYATGKHR